MTDRRGRARRWQSELRAPMTRKISELSCYIIILVPLLRKTVVGRMEPL